MKIVQTTTFRKAVKRGHANQKNALVKLTEAL
jgi:hypothetical protein